MIIEFKKKNRINGNTIIGGTGGSSFDPSSLRFVPYDDSDDTVWLIPDKPIRAKEGIHSDKTITSAGDIIALTPNAVVFAAADDAAGGSQYLYQLLDVEIVNPSHGAMLVYDGATQKWNNANEIVIDGGTYSII